MDILKHGESAYPADAWVEQQYMKEEIQIPGTPRMPRQDSTDTNITSVGAREEVSRKTSTLSVSTKNGLPPQMKYSRSASYNNPHEMFPSESKLFTGMTQLAGNIAVDFDSRPGKTTIRLRHASAAAATFFFLLNPGKTEVSKNIRTPKYLFF